MLIAILPTTIGLSTDFSTIWTPIFPKGLHRGVVSSGLTLPYIGGDDAAQQDWPGGCIPTQILSS